MGDVKPLEHDHQHRLVGRVEAGAVGQVFWRRAVRRVDIAQAQVEHLLAHEAVQWRFDRMLVVAHGVAAMHPDIVDEGLGQGGGGLQLIQARWQPAEDAFAFGMRIAADRQARREQGHQQRSTDARHAIPEFVAI